MVEFVDCWVRLSEISLLKKYLLREQSSLWWDQIHLDLMWVTSLWCSRVKRWFRSTHQNREQEGAYLGRNYCFCWDFRGPIFQICQFCSHEILVRQRAWFLLCEDDLSYTGIEQRCWIQTEWGNDLLKESSEIQNRWIKFCPWLDIAFWVSRVRFSSFQRCFSCRLTLWTPGYS
jgi:hypothetical protein